MGKKGTPTVKKGQFNLHKIAQISCAVGRKQIPQEQEQAGKAEIERMREREKERRRDRASELGINII